MGAQRNSPKPSPMKKPTTLQFLFDLDSKSSDNEKLSPFESENDEILSIISYCTLTPKNGDLDVEYSSLKRLKLTQLLSIIKTSRNPIHDQTLIPLFTMLSSNLFRPLPPPTTTSTTILPEEEDFTTTPSAAWAHLQIVYDILLRIIITLDAKSLHKDQFLSRIFVLNLLNLFKSEDARERDALKNVFHRIYAKFTFYRSFMRKAMIDVFLNYMYGTLEDQKWHWGIGELLEIWGSIINGFTVPLKEEHKIFLIRVLVPLHKPNNMESYHRQLAYCVSQFVLKDCELSGVVVKGILKHWPLTNCQKEVLLIGEMEEIVENIDQQQYLKIALPLCTQIAKCINSWNSQVAERALYVWNSEQFIKVASQEIDEVFPILVKCLEKNLKWHWSKSVRQLTKNVKIMLEELEPVLYSRCVERIETRELEAREKKIQIMEGWTKIYEMAEANNESIQNSSSSICSN